MSGGIASASRELHREVDILERAEVLGFLRGVQLDCGITERAQRRAAPILLESPEPTPSGSDWFSIGVTPIKRQSVSLPGYGRK